MFYFTLIILIIILFIVLWKWQKVKCSLIEGIDSSKSTQGSSFGSTTKKPFEGTFNSTFNGRMAINDFYFYDKLFDNVTYYPNVYEDGELVSTGWVNCKQECKGNCVEFGVHGDSWCFSNV